MANPGYEVSLQGLTSDQVLVLIDGLPISASTSSTVDLSQYSLADVEHIEVIKGAASAQYGSSAMGGGDQRHHAPPRRRLRRARDAGCRQLRAPEPVRRYAGYRQQNMASSIFTAPRAPGAIASARTVRTATASPLTRTPGASRAMPYCATSSTAISPGSRRPERASGSMAAAIVKKPNNATPSSHPPNLVPQRKTEIIDRDRLTAGRRLAPCQRPGLAGESAQRTVRQSLDVTLEQCADHRPHR